MGFSLYEDYFVFSPETIAAYAHRVPGIQTYARRATVYGDLPEGWMLPGIYSLDVDELLERELTITDDLDSWYAWSKTPTDIFSRLGVEHQQVAFASYLSLFDSRGVVLCRDDTHAGIQADDEIAVLYQSGMFVFAAFDPSGIGQSKPRPRLEWDSGWIEGKVAPIWAALTRVDDVFEEEQPYDRYLPRSTGWDNEMELVEIPDVTIPDFFL